MESRRRILSAMLTTLGGAACARRLGPRWDPAKPAHEQAYFREHSANPKKMRDDGHLLVGAR